jgi:hypothetical protein
LAEVPLFGTAHFPFLWQLKAVTVHPFFEV